MSKWSIWHSLCNFNILSIFSSYSLSSSLDIYHHLRDTKCHHRKEISSHKIKSRWFRGLVFSLSKDNLKCFWKFGVLANQIFYMWWKLNKSSEQRNLKLKVISHLPVKGNQKLKKTSCHIANLKYITTYRSVVWVTQESLYDSPGQSCLEVLPFPTFSHTSGCDSEVSLRSHSDSLFILSSVWHAQFYTCPTGGNHDVVLTACIWGCGCYFPWCDWPAAT